MGADSHRCGWAILWLVSVCIFESIILASGNTEKQKVQIAEKQKVQTKEKQKVQSLESQSHPNHLWSAGYKVKHKDLPDATVWFASPEMWRNALMNYKKQADPSKVAWLKIRSKRIMAGIAAEKKSSSDDEKHSAETDDQGQESERESSNMLEHVKHLADREDSDYSEYHPIPVPAPQSEPKNDMLQHVKQLVEKDDDDDSDDNQARTQRSQARTISSMLHTAVVDADNKEDKDDDEKEDKQGKQDKDDDDKDDKDDKDDDKDDKDDKKDAVEKPSLLNLHKPNALTHIAPKNQPDEADVQGPPQVLTLSPVNGIIPPFSSESPSDSDSDTDQPGYSLPAGFPSAAAAAAAAAMTPEDYAKWYAAQHPKAKQSHAFKKAAAPLDPMRAVAHDVAHDVVIERQSSSTPALDRLSSRQFTPASTGAFSATAPMPMKMAKLKQDLVGSPVPVQNPVGVPQQPAQQEPVQREAQWVDSVVTNSAMSSASNFADSAAAYSGLAESFSDPSPAAFSSASRSLRKKKSKKAAPQPLSDYADPAIVSDGVSNEPKSQVKLADSEDSDKVQGDKVVSALDSVVDGLESIKMHVPPQSRRLPAPANPEILVRSKPDKLFDDGWKRPAPTAAPTPVVVQKPFQELAAKLKAAQEASRPSSLEDTTQEREQKEIADLLLHPRKIPQPPLNPNALGTESDPLLAKLASKLPHVEAPQPGVASPHQPSRIRAVDQAIAAQPAGQQTYYQAPHVIQQSRGEVDFAAPKDSPRTSAKQPQSVTVPAKAPSKDAAKVQIPVPDVLPVVEQLMDSPSEQQLTELSYPQVEHAPPVSGAAGIDLSPEQQSILQSLDGVAGVPSGNEQPFAQTTVQVQPRAQALKDAAQAKFHARQQAIAVAKAKQAQDQALAKAHAEIVAKANAEAAQRAAAQRAQAQRAAAQRAQAQAKAAAELRAKQQAAQATFKKQAALRAVQEQRNQIDNLQKKIQQEKSAQSNGLNVIADLSSKFTSLFQR